MPSGTKQPPGAVEAAVLTRIRAAVKAREISQASVAQAVGISPAQLSRILAGKKPATFTEMVGIAHALGLDLSAVVDQAEQDVPAAPRRAVRARTAKRRTSPQPVDNDSPNSVGSVGCAE